MRLVLDTNILVRAFVCEKGNARKALRAALNGEHSLVASPEIIREVARMLREPRLMLLHKKTEDDIYSFAAWLREVCEIAILNLVAHSPIRDPGDTNSPRRATTFSAETLGRSCHFWQRSAATEVVSLFRWFCP